LDDSAAAEHKRRSIPWFLSLHGYQRVWARPDLAGLTVWAVLVPESLAYVTIAGVSPVVGPYAAQADGLCDRRRRHHLRG
jgi:MFS superfamily sulfate permease-like transporter